MGEQVKGDDNADGNGQVELTFPLDASPRFSQGVGYGLLRNDLKKGIEMQGLAELAFSLEFTYLVLDRVTPGNGLTGITILPQRVPEPPLFERY